MRRLHWCLIILLGACSPYDFSKEVGDFSTGVDQLSSSFNAGYSSLAADRAAAVHQALIDSRARVTTTVSCGVPGHANDQTRQPCAVLQQGKPEPQPLGSQVDQAAVAEKLKLLGAYVHGLQAVTNAADRTAFDAAAKRLEGAISNLAKNAGAAAPGAGAIAPAATHLVLWVVGAALDNQRFDTLQKAVNLAKDHVRSISILLGTALQELASNRRTVLRHAADKVLVPLGPKMALATYKERLGLGEATLAELDAVLVSNPDGAAGALGDAHDALVAAVNDPKPNFANLLSSVADFAAAAKTLKDALSTPAK